MTNKDLFLALGALDPALIEAGAPAERPPAKGLPAAPHFPKGHHTWRKWGTVAACLVLCAAILLGTVFLTPLLWGNDPVPPPAEEPVTPEEPYLPPTFENAYLTAEDVEAIFWGGWGASAPAVTTAYQKFYYAEGALPHLTPLPTGATAEVYRASGVQMATDAEAFAAFVSLYRPRIEELLGIGLDEFRKREDYDEAFALEEYYHSDRGWSINFQQYLGGQDIQDFAHQELKISNMSVNIIPFSLGGRQLYIDATKSDAELLASVEWARDLLFEALGCSFDAVKVEVHYAAFYGPGPYSVVVTYYNEGGTPFEGDSLVLGFRNPFSSDGVTVADRIRLNSVTYTTYRTPLSELVEVEVACPLIPLSTAEELLYNGYVFGGHSCALCMSRQEGVAFDGYDFVELEYVASFREEAMRAIPFYAFYKRIGRTEKGIVIYAKTYVCALEVSGLAAYYEKQQASHP